MTASSLDPSRLTAVISPLRRSLLAAARESAGLPDIPDAQVEVIRALPRGTTSSPGELAASLGIGRSTVSNLLAAMERGGLVTRRARTDDRRAVEVAASDDALALFDRFDAASAIIMADAARALTGDDVAVLAAAVPALERLRDALVAARRDPSPPQGARMTVFPAPPVPHLEHAFDVAVELGALQDHGATRAGHRRVIPILGGVITGGLDAVILPGGADWQRVRADGSIEIDGRYTARTPDGEYLYLQALGVRSGSPEVLAALLRGEAVSPDDYYFRTTVTIETSAPRLAHLERSLFVSSCLRDAAAVRYAAYRVT